MSILPWDNWFYHIDKLKHKAKTLHHEAEKRQDRIRSEISIFNEYLKQYKQIILNNSALILISNEIIMTDLKWKDFNAELEELPEPPKGSIPAKVGSFIAEGVGGVLLLKGLANMKKLMVDGLFSEVEGGGVVIEESVVESVVESSVEVGLEVTGEAAGEIVAEGATEAAIESATIGSLAATGIGIIAAVGVDAIFGAINGAKEKKELEKQIRKLRKALDKLTVFSATVDKKLNEIKTGIVTQEQLFLDIMKNLNKIMKADFNWNLQCGLEHLADFKTASDNAIVYYGILVKMRTLYQWAAERNPQISKDQFITTFSTRYPNISFDTIKAYWDILTTYSTEMKNINNG